MQWQHCRDHTDRNPQQVGHTPRSTPRNTEAPESPIRAPTCRDVKWRIRPRALDWLLYVGQKGHSSNGGRIAGSRCCCSGGGGGGGGGISSGESVRLTLGGTSSCESGRTKVGVMEPSPGAAAGMVGGTAMNAARRSRRVSELAAMSNLPWESSQAPRASGFESRHAPPCLGPPATVSVQLQVFVAVR